MLSSTVRLNNEERILLSHGLKLIEERQDYPRELPGSFDPDDMKNLIHKVRAEKPNKS